MLQGALSFWLDVSIGPLCISAHTRSEICGCVKMVRLLVSESNWNLSGTVPSPILTFESCGGRGQGRWEGEEEGGGGGGMWSRDVWTSEKALLLKYPGTLRTLESSLSYSTLSVQPLVKLQGWLLPIRHFLHQWSKWKIGQRRMSLWAAKNPDEMMKGFAEVTQTSHYASSCLDSWCICVENYPAAAANRSLRCAYRKSLGSTRVRLDLCQLFCEWLKQPSYKQKMCGDLILNIIQRKIMWSHWVIHGGCIDHTIQRH